MKPFDLKEYLANPNKKVVTRDGRNVKIYCTNYYCQHPIIAQIEGEERSHAFRETGHYNICGESTGDLFFAPEKHEGWINIFYGKDGPLTGNVIFASKEEAEESSRHCCGFTEGLYVTSGKIEWEE